MTSSQSGIHVVQPTTSSHSQSERDRLIGKPRFHFEPQSVMQLLRERIIGQDAALNEIEKCCMWSRLTFPVLSVRFRLP